MLWGYSKAVLLGLPERSTFKCQRSMAKSITADLQGHGNIGWLTRRRTSQSRLQIISIAGPNI